MTDVRHTAGMCDCGGFHSEVALLKAEVERLRKRESVLMAEKADLVLDAERLRVALDTALEQMGRGAYISAGATLEHARDV